MRKCGVQNGKMWSATFDFMTWVLQKSCGWTTRLCGHSLLHR